MSDLIDQRVREAFMEFRDEAQRTIRAPGSPAARRSVNRRRLTGTAIAAAGLAAALIGVWVVVRPPTTPAPFTSDPASPTVPPMEYEDSVQTAFSRAQYPTYDPAWETISNSPIWWGPTATESTGPRTFRYPGTEPGAEISMTVACAGTGSITVTVQTVNTSSEIPASCDEDGLPEYHTIQTVTADQAVEVSVRGDEQVTPEGAFVVAMTDPRSLAARSALGPAPTAESIVSTATTYNSFGNGTSSRPVGPGRYHLALYCIGDVDPVDVAQIRVRLTLGAQEVGDEVACPAEGARLELEVASVSGDELELSISESGSFGYAYSLSRTELPS
jgi:hypothetical protein